MHLNQLFVYLLLGIVSGAAGAPVSSNVIASSEFTTGITQSSNVESSSDPDIRTIGALSHPTQIVVPVDSHSVMEARSRNISEGWHEVGSDEDDDEKWEEIHHPGQAPGHPTKSTAAAHPEPPRTVANVPKQKPKAPERKNSLVSLLSYTWDGIKTGRIGDNEVSLMDTLIHDEAVDLIDQAAKYEWGLTNYLINHQNPYMYPAAAHPDTMNTTEFKFLLKLEYDYGGKGTNYCEGQVRGEPEDRCIGIIRWGKDESGKRRISELRNKDGVVTQIPPI
ncbi:uncharacterized protein C8R40DRAFT_1066877 [Lentinula edodes]|uniref:uncharacterized protein n=1 Tax=Lentinula edodes TaxID=5353 RepID=UPI001E8D3457|nr:uncharacterized protein C8R40DRAFT_1066877 [Lentinula edodes]KAH7878414.1 hypothetical protein C8R40DRAFT_1066877 [Lentinula edodes]